MNDELKLPQVGELTLPQWQNWLVRYNAVLNERERRIEKLEAALRSVLQYRLTDETWVKLGFDPKKIRVEFDAARKALEEKDE
jgi:hypothetical protein